MDRNAHEFFEEFGRMEHDMKRGDFLKKKKDNAEADWVAFAKFLVEKFFEEVRKSGEADTLIDRPPRKLKWENGTLKWLPEKARPLANIEELLVQGICRVRNNLFHGEKFVGPIEGAARDAELLTQSRWVLHSARVKLNDAHKPSKA